jgi:hypothetical protein
MQNFVVLVLALGLPLQMARVAASHMPIPARMSSLVFGRWRLTIGSDAHHAVRTGLYSPYFNASVTFAVS